MDERRQDTARQAALDYHEFPRPGKLEIRATKPLANGRDLSRAYSPGVAEACIEIRGDAAAAARYTARGNLVAVVSNGTAVLGLGNIGPLASKPVMEGKAVLFKKFANIDCFDIEVNESDPERLAAIVRALEPTFGAINLEDIKAPDCFIVEKLCRESMNIPVFHDDQHGTAIVVGAAATNALLVAGKRFEDIKVVSTGGGAAGIACLNMLLKLGVRRENVWLCDIHGLVHEGRDIDMNPEKAAFAQATDLRTLDDVIDGADLFLGLSGPGVLAPGMVARMASPPIVFALANPQPEIMPEEVRAARPDAIIATGRSDYPNQVNNVLCFPFIFRGALDVGATTINEEMKLAATQAIAAIAEAEPSDVVASAYGTQEPFGPDYLIPKPFDPRLIGVVATAVARAAMQSGVAARPVADLDAYKRNLDSSVFRSALIMRPVFEAAATATRRIVFADGEDERVLRAANAMLEETTEVPILIGRPDVIATRCERAALPIRPETDFEIVNPESDSRYRDYWETYHRLMARRGVTPDVARSIMRTNTTAIGAIMVHRNEADSLICGAVGQFSWHLDFIRQVLGRDGLDPIGALSMMILQDEPIFIADTQVNHDPTPEQVAASAVGAARHVRRFGLTPRIALCSHSQFGNLDTYSGRKMRAALALLDAAQVDFIYEGEMHVDAALDPSVRERIFPGSRLGNDAANVLIFAGSDAASGVRNILKTRAEGLEVGPILMGMGNRAHIVTPSITTRGLLNISALAGTPVAHYG